MPTPKSAQQYSLALTLTALSTVFLLGCQPPEETSGATEQHTPLTLQDSQAQHHASEHFWQQGNNSFIATVKATGELRDSVMVFLNDSSNESLQKLRQQWHRAHNIYAANGIYTALNSSNSGFFTELDAISFRIDAHPIQPGYIDSFDVYSRSGMVNDIAVPITAQAVRAQHGLMDGSDISTGFHALAYLIFGENGQRPLAQLQVQKKLLQSQINNGLTVNDLSVNRRRNLIKLLSELLLDDMRELQRQWQLKNGSLRTSYMALTPPSRLELIRQAGEQVLAGQEQAFEQAPDLIQNRFAGGEQERSRAALVGLNKTIDASISAQIFSEDEAHQWQQRLQNALNKLSPSDQKPL